MRIFITGGTGFIGPYVIKQLLKDGHDLVLLSYEEEELKEDFLELLQDTEIISGALSNISKWKKRLKDFGPELTVHMAWQGIPDYNAKTSILNLNNSLNLYLTLADINCKRILTTGSCWEYGRTEGQLSEEMHPKPFNPFSVAKNALRMMGAEIAKENEIQFIWTRFFYVYGPGQKPSSLLPSIINSVLKKRTPQIKTPDSKNDFIFVEDIAAAVAMIIRKCKLNQAIYNIGSGYSTSVRELIEIAYEKSNLPLPEGIFTQSQPSTDLVDFWADISKIKADIGWKPTVSVNKGIQKMLDYYSSIISK
ncbi:MAG: NAD-dependent epimerase/dehydratase family protein [Candidatus Hodarchaeales archaeon]|jgi:dTDP-6-deoxy-L-talose 4-dehydrogenase (NAD+)